MGEMVFKRMLIAHVCGGLAAAVIVVESWLGAGAVGAGDTEVCRVTLKVLAPEGAALKYESLRLTYTGTIGISRVEREARCDAQGVAQVDVPAGKWRLEVVPTESEPFWGVLDLDVAEDATALEATLSLQKTGLHDVELTVLYESDRKPVPAATVRVSHSPRMDDLEEAGITDSNGTLRMKGLWEHKEYRLFVDDQRLSRFQERAIDPKELKAGSLVWLVRVPPPSTPVTVQLFVKEGDRRVPFTEERAAAEHGEIRTRYLDCVWAYVNPKTQALRPYCGDARERIDADGKCVIRGLEHGTYMVRNVRLRTKAEHLELKYYFPIDGDISFTVPEEVTDGIDVNVVVGLEPAQVRLEGKVIDTWNKSPLADATVRAELVAPIDAALDKTAEVTTSKDGTFELSLQPAIYQISVQREGFAAPPEVMYVLPGKSVELSGHPVFAVEGVVTHEGRAPSGWTEVRLSVGEYLVLDFCDEEGRFRFENIDPGRHLVLVSVEGFPTWAREIEVTEDVELDVSLERGVTLSGTVTAEAPAELKGVPLLAFVDTETNICESHAWVSANGKYEAAVRKKQLAVYLAMGRHWYRLGKITVDKDGVTKDFRITKEILDNPIDREKLDFK